MFTIRPFPEFSWSITRQRLLDNCPRAYYYRYYLSHNGWLPEAPQLAKRAYRYSKLTNLDALLGQQIDQRARELETAARAGDPLPSADELETRTRVALREAWRSSEDLRAVFEAKPNAVTMLRSFYIEGSPPATVETVRMNEKLAISHANLVAAPHWARLRECATTGCVSIDAFAHFELGDIKVYAAGDLAYVHDDTVYLIDWKSGRPSYDDPVQVTLATHALLQTNSHLSGLPVQASLYYLLTGQERVVELPADLEKFAAETVHAGVQTMRSYLRDVESNAPLDMREFPRRESALCSTCNFAELCIDEI
jgi:hypothetical protein